MDEDRDLQILARKIRELTGIEIGYYKPNQLHRRLGNMMTRVGASSLAEYGDVLASNAEALEHFVDKFTINVSELFRNPEKFAELEEHYLRPLVKRFGTLRIWSAGCSIGAEVYSVAMQMAVLDPSKRHRFLATDIDNGALDKARRAEYGPNDVRCVPKEHMGRFIAEEDGKFKVKDEIKRCVEFRKHDLLQDRFDRGFHLILCRNVVIYFNDEAKAGLYRRFFDALVPGGTLFVGGTERIADAREIGYVSSRPFFYTRPGDQDTGDTAPNLRTARVGGGTVAGGGRP